MRIREREDWDENEGVKWSRTSKRERREGVKEKRKERDREK